MFLRTFSFALSWFPNSLPYLQHRYEVQVRNAHVRCKDALIEEESKPSDIFGGEKTGANCSHDQRYDFIVEGIEVERDYGKAHDHRPESSAVVVFGLLDKQLGNEVA